MIILSVAEVIELHGRVVAASGGSQGIREPALLEAAVLGCYQTFDGSDLYPSIEEKAARIAYAMSSSHPFVDGNKRAAVVSMLVILRLNDVVIQYSQQELFTLGVGIADGTFCCEDILSWIRKHILI